MQARPHVVIGLSTVQREMVRKSLGDLDSPGVDCTSRSSMLFPLVDVSPKPVGVYLRPVCIRYNDGPIWPTNRTPYHVWARVGSSGIVDHDRTTLLFAKLQGGVCHNVVNGVIDSMGRRIADGQLMYKNPFVQRWDVRNNGHSRASNVLIVRNVINDRAPMLEICRLLVCKFLAVLGVTLIRVVSGKPAFVLSVSQSACAKT